MDTAKTANGKANVMATEQLLLVQNPDFFHHGKFTIQQALYKWYNLLNTFPPDPKNEAVLFPNSAAEEMEQNLQADIELIPALLIEEMSNETTKYNQTQYIRLVQALLVNISDDVSIRGNMTREICHKIEYVLQFIQNFFYQQFDFNYRIPYCRLDQLRQTIALKLEYWKIKLNHAPLIDVLVNCLVSDNSAPESYISFAQLYYLTNLFKQIDLAAPAITEELIRQMLIRHNFNTECFVDYEMKLITNKLDGEPALQKRVTVLYEELSVVNHMAVKPGICYDAYFPSLKNQLSARIQDAIRQTEQRNTQENQKEFLIEPDSKIQTTLSVAKLAVLIRLLVVDKIIVNKSVASVLRTVAKLFTTLQKDEISVGSLETKYHAPDKATLEVMREMMHKWVIILGKL